MRSHLCRAVFVATNFFAMAVMANSPAHAETNNCTEITALPFTITVQGIYCLKQNLNVNLATGNAITINAGNVTIDFNGWRVNNQAATTEANGVFAQDRRNITVRNGFVRGFESGVIITKAFSSVSSSHIVEGMKILDSTLAGIFVGGDNSIVRDNRVSGVGGNASTGAEGILVAGTGDIVVSGNLVSGVNETGFSYGILVQAGFRVHVFENIITNISGAGNVYGIAVQNGNNVSVKNNKLLNDIASGTIGILDSFNSSLQLSCLDNDIGGYVTALAGCDFADGNRVLFN